MAIQVLSTGDLEALVRAAPAREEFGPQSSRPSLVIALEGTSEEHNEWLRQIPCPVVGIGEGACASACDAVFASEDEAETTVTNIERWPLASLVLVQHLRASEMLSVTDALVAESFAYATLQKGPEFQHWLDSEGPQAPKPAHSDTPLHISRERDALILTLDDPDNLNAIGTVMRDTLSEALDLALRDSSIKRVAIRANGKCFSTGGAVDEFGEVSDPATAHWVRSLRLPAHKLAAFEGKLDVHVSGAAIGAGAEISAFGTHVTACEEAWFQLPELKYGLIPGAGGTVSLTRRIGRQRTAQLVLSMKRISAQTALEWGLVDEIVS